MKIENRLKEIREDLSEGQKEIENMHEYYWDNYTEMDQYGYEEYDNRQGASSADECKHREAEAEASLREDAGRAVFRTG